MNTKYIPFPDKINLYRQTRELIYNDLSKNSLAASKKKALLGKVIGQLKVEKVNSRALQTQNEEFKNLIIKLGVNPEDKTTIQKFLQGEEFEMKMLRKKVQKKSKFVKRKRSSKRKKGPSPYNNFVKSKFAVYKKEQPGLKAPEIMKKIAKEWKSRSVNAPQPEK